MEGMVTFREAGTGSVRVLTMRKHIKGAVSNLIFTVIQLQDI